jgi:hypothetical protein
VIQDVIYTYETSDEVTVIFDTRAPGNYKVLNGNCTGNSFALLGTVCSASGNAVT